MWGWNTSDLIILDKGRKRRIKRLEVNLDSFLDLLRYLDGTWVIEVARLPDDAHVVGVSLDPWNPHMIRVYIESDAFPEWSNDGQPPDMHLNFTRTDIGRTRAMWAR